jgi:dipeptidyl aminopeptidase/acylaminoacyl peptidase
VLGASVAAVLATLFLPAEPRVTISGHYDRLVFAPDGRTFIIAETLGRPDARGIVPWPEKVTRLRLWDATGRQRRSADFPMREVKTVAFAPDGHRVAVLASRQMPVQT